MGMKFDLLALWNDFRTILDLFHLRSRFRWRVIIWTFPVDPQVLQYRRLWGCWGGGYVCGCCYFLDWLWWHSVDKWDDRGRRSVTLLGGGTLLDRCPVEAVVPTPKRLLFLFGLVTATRFGLKGKNIQSNMTLCTRIMCNTSSTN